MKTLGYITVILLSLATVSCRNTKHTMEVVNPENVEEAPVKTERLVGTVDIIDECGAVIRVIQGDVERNYLPLNLEDKFKVAGMKIRFTSAASDKKLEGECAFYQPITVSDVTILR